MVFPGAIRRGLFSACSRAPWRRLAPLAVPDPKRVTAPGTPRTDLISERVIFTGPELVIIPCNAWRAAMSVLSESEKASPTAEVEGDPPVRRSFSITATASQTERSLSSAAAASSRFCLPSKEKGIPTQAATVMPEDLARIASAGSRKDPDSPPRPPQSTTDAAPETMSPKAPSIARNPSAGSPSGTARRSVMTEADSDSGSLFTQSSPFMPGFSRARKRPGAEPLICPPF